MKIAAFSFLLFKLTEQSELYGVQRCENEAMDNFRWGFYSIALGGVFPNITQQLFLDENDTQITNLIPQKWSLNIKIDVFSYYALCTVRDKCSTIGLQVDGLDWMDLWEG